MVWDINPEAFIDVLPFLVYIVNILIYNMTVAEMFDHCTATFNSRATITAEPSTFFLLYFLYSLIYFFVLIIFIILPFLLYKKGEVPCIGPMASDLSDFLWAALVIIPVNVSAFRRLVNAVL